MSQPETQDLKHHASLDPIFHYFLVWISLTSIVIAIVFAVRHPDFYSVWIVVVAFAAFFALFRLRTYPLKVQDRIIRLEERLRLHTLTPSEWRPQIDKLTEDQLIALRFASDKEVVELAKLALDQNLNRKQIKERIQSWRPDHWRV
jgi:hypothetical protein